MVAVVSKAKKIVPIRRQVRRALLSSVPFASWHVGLCVECARRWDALMACAEKTSHVYVHPDGSVKKRP